MSTDNIGATAGDFLFPSCFLPPNVGACGRNCSKASPRVYQHAGAVCSFIDSHCQALPLNTPFSVETVPDPNTSHDCHQGPPLSNNSSPVQSVVHDPHFEPRQYSPDSPWTDASLDEEFLLGSFPDPCPPLSLPESALSLTHPFLVPGVGSPPSESSCATFIPQGPEFSGSPVGNPPAADIFHYRQSRNDRLDRTALMPAISQAATIRYRANDIDAITPNGLQSSCQLSHQPSRKPPYPGPVPEPYFGTAPIPSSSRPFPVYDTANYSSSPPLQAAMWLQSRATNAECRPEKKYRCSSCQRGFTQPQVLSRHVKDTHEAKESCPHCLSQGSNFTFSKGRPYVYRKHLAKQHPEIAPPKRASRYTKESSNLGARQTQIANYVPPLIKAVPLQLMSHYSWAN